MKKGMKKELSAKEKEKIKKKIAEIPKENLRFSKNGRPYDKELRECRKHTHEEGEEI